MTSGKTHLPPIFKHLQTVLCSCVVVCFADVLVWDVDMMCFMMHYLARDAVEARRKTLDVLFKRKIMSATHGLAGNLSAGACQQLIQIFLRRVKRSVVERSGFSFFFVI